MSLFKFCATFVFLSSALLAQCGISQKDFSGVGHVLVLNSSDWRYATPNQTVGCLDQNGRFIAPTDDIECGVYTRLDDYPYTLSSTLGNCTFNDAKTVTNKDSYYGGSDHAWTCNATYEAIIYDELYTIDGFPYVFLCSGDINCYYDAKKIPGPAETAPLWQFRWGSQQRGITPGHVQLQLLWTPLNTGKRKSVSDIPSPRLRLNDGAQIPLQGQEIKS
ncbi:hypothetical protein BDV96DRAFT_610919 [Lophiotrema nucula]|uniref:Uncharacterized protein n=1 Tax=Lophiotrema nucula TaxID=690887 RepID=A0A6A5ZL30_9PLEO|nr:hypothetical protein BDV96DRAFT_610919 [Lophiotrema nucula]